MTPSPSARYYDVFEQGARLTLGPDVDDTSKSSDWNSSHLNLGHRTLAGTARVFAAEALIFPTGLITAAFLTRMLGTEGYGVLTLAGTLVAWVEWGTLSLFSRATIKVVRDTDPWHPIAGRILQLSLLTSGVVAIALWLAAPSIATALGAPTLAAPLRLFTIDVPIFVYTATHNGVLTGLGLFGLRARVVAARWIARLVLVLVLVGLGLSVTGAILASIGATLVSLFFATRYERPRLGLRSPTSARPFLTIAVPIFLATLCRRFYTQIDLLAVKAIGGTMATAGLYGAAQTLSLAVGVVATAFSPLLLSSLSELARDDHMVHARGMARDALRGIVLLAPFAALASGAADEIVRFIFGAEFAASGPLLARLIVASWAWLVIAVASTVLIAAGRPTWPLWVSVPLAIAVVPAHMWAIPRWGAVGAASVTTIVSLVGALSMLGLVFRAWEIAIPLRSVARGAVVLALAFTLATTWTTPGALVVLKLVTGCTGIVAAYLVLGEFDARERALIRSVLRSPAGDR